MPTDDPWPAQEARVRESFARQALMRVLDARLVALRPGHVALEMPYVPTLTQQHGYLHAGIVTALADSACGWAALSRMPPGADVLSVELKINLLAPAAGARFRATGDVLRAGRTLSVCRADVHAWADGDAAPVLVAAMQATMFAVVHPRHA